MADKTPRFQKSKSKKAHDSSAAGYFGLEDEKHKKQIAEIESILDKSTDFLSEKDIKNIKRLLSKLSQKLMEELKQALINKQMSGFRDTDVLDEDNNLSP